MSRRPLLLLVLVCALAGPALAEESAAASPDPVGRWQGTLRFGPNALRLRFDVTGRAGSGLAVSMTSLDQGGGAIPGRIEVDGAEVRIVISSISGTYVGHLAADGATMTGRWQQLGQDVPLDLARTDETPDAATPTSPNARLDDQPHGPELPGVWLGTLRLGVTSLRLQFQVTEQDGRLDVAMESLDQRARSVVAYAELRPDRAVVFRTPTIGGLFAGTLDAAGDTLRGEWRQNGQTFPLDLGRIAVAVSVNRPQEPQPPFPYAVTDVAFAGGDSAVTLAGTLTMPAGEGPFPAAVLVSGSGPQDRNEELFGHKPFLVLADHLTRAGIAVLRYDDRGTAGSTGTFATATTADFARDAAAAVDFLAARDDVDRQAIGLIGHSEGGVVAPLVAADRDDLGWIVMLAGTGVPGREILARQTELMLRAAGEPEQEIRSLLEAFAVAFAAMDAESDPERLADDVFAALQDWAATAADAPDSTALRGLATQIAGPWFRWFLALDPAAVLAEVRCPVLALWGGLDLQVDPAQNLPAVEAALQRGRSPDWQVRAFPGLNHLFQTATTGAMSEYGEIEETMAPAVLAAVTDWILAVTGR